MTARRTNGHAYVSLSGDLDAYALEQIAAVLRRTVGDPIVIDLHEARMVSAAFIGELVRLRKRVPSRIELIGASPPVRRILSLVHVDEILATRRPTAQAKRAGRL